VKHAASGGGLGLALVQPLENLTLALQGKPPKDATQVECSDGHGPMRQVDETVRLQIKAEE